MESNEKEKIIEKAQFYFTEKIEAHVLTVPKGTFKNGKFDSELKEDKYFWFTERDSKISKRLFLAEIHDVEDYVGVGE